VVCGLVCTTSSGFSSGWLFSMGVLVSGFHCVCARAWLVAFGISTGEEKNILTNVQECREDKLIWCVSLVLR